MKNRGMKYLITICIMTCMLGLPGCGKSKVPAPVVVKDILNLGDTTEFVNTYYTNIKVECVDLQKVDGTDLREAKVNIVMPDLQQIYGQIESDKMDADTIFEELAREMTKAECMKTISSTIPAYKTEQGWAYDDDILITEVNRLIYEQVDELFGTILSEADVEEITIESLDITE